jgi:hypothetical protein
MDDLMQARAESIVELANDIVDAVLKTAKTHGEDPHLSHIIVSGFTLAAQDLDRVAPGFTEFLVGMLKEDLTDE